MWYHVETQVFAVCEQIGAFIMKYVIVLGDGMADEPIEALGGKTPLEYANTPVI